MMAGAVGAYVGVPIAGAIQGFFIPLMILEIALLFGLNFVKHKPGINLAPAAIKEVLQVASHSAFHQ